MSNIGNSMDIGDGGGGVGGGSCGAGGGGGGGGSCGAGGGGGGGIIYGSDRAPEEITKNVIDLRAEVRTQHYLYNKINYIRQHYLFLFIYKATCFDPSVGHLQAYIADYVIGAVCTLGSQKFYNNKIH